MNESSHRITPMLEQYLSIKSNYPDTLLFYRMGDFYELFFEDAETAARELQIALTARNPRAENPVPMCGVPWHAADSYIHQLIQKGYKVALCEQTEDFRESKGLVQRKVTRVFTSATTTEETSLDPKTHTYLGAMYWDEEVNIGAFCWADVSTGLWTGIQVKKKSELWQWIQKILPKELLFPEKYELPATAKLIEIQFVPLPYKTHFEYPQAVKRLLQAQGVADLEALGLEKHTILVQACGALVAYLEQTQLQDVNHLMPFKPLDIGKYVILDEITEKNLELFKRVNGKKGVGTLIHVLDHTLTPMGGRLLEERLHHPWRDITTILENQSVLEWLILYKENMKKLQDALKAIYDLERLSTRIVLNRTSPKDLLALKNTLLILPRVKDALIVEINVKDNRYITIDESILSTMPTILRQLLTKWDNISDYAEKLDKALDENPPNSIVEGGLFKLGFNAELDELMDLLEHGESKLQALLEKEQKVNNLPRLKIGFNRVFGYYFELTKSAGTPPSHFVRRQTLANAERYTTEELKDLEERLLSATEKRNTLEYKLFQKLREELVSIRPRILFMASLIAQLDLWQSLADVAIRHNWNKPTLLTNNNIFIREGRHPVIESIIGKSVFVPNDLVMDETRRMLLITGPNMAGKSTVLRQTAIICLLAHMGSFVPATEAQIGICDRIFSRVGASDNLARGQSTFMVEMMETARILRQATSRSLVILDEIGRGTSTFDGLALAWAVAEDLVCKDHDGVRTLFATHYHELTALEEKLTGVHTMTIDIRHWNDELVFLYRLIPGPADRSYGIEVARLAGVPQSVIQRAKIILTQLEQTHQQPRSLLNLLPGVVQNANEELSKQDVKVVEHPVVTLLKEMNPETLTPLDALKSLVEWKLLYGTTHAT